MKKNSFSYYLEMVVKNENTLASAQSLIKKEIETFEALENSDNFIKFMEWFKEKWTAGWTNTTKNYILPELEYKNNSYRIRFQTPASTPKEESKKYSHTLDKTGAGPNGTVGERYTKYLHPLIDAIKAIGILKEEEYVSNNKIISIIKKKENREKLLNNNPNLEIKKIIELFKDIKINIEDSKRRENLFKALGLHLKENFKNKTKDQFQWVKKYSADAYQIDIEINPTKKIETK